MDDRVRRRNLIRSTRVEDSASSVAAAVTASVTDDSSTYTCLDRFEGEEVELPVLALVAFRFLEGVAEDESSVDDAGADGEGEGSPKSANERRSAVNMTLCKFKRSIICFSCVECIHTECAHPA